MIGGFLIAGEKVGLAECQRESLFPSRRDVQFGESVQDAADGRNQIGETPRRSAGETDHGEGGPRAAHPGRTPGAGRDGARATIYALQGRPRRHTVLTGICTCITQPTVKSVIRRQRGKSQRLRSCCKIFT